MFIQLFRLLQLFSIISFIPNYSQLFHLFSIIPNISNISIFVIIPIILVHIHYSDYFNYTQLELFSFIHLQTQSFQYCHKIEQYVASIAPFCTKDCTFSCTTIYLKRIAHTICSYIAQHCTKLWSVFLPLLLHKDCVQITVK